LQQPWPCTFLTTALSKKKTNPRRRPLAAAQPPTRAHTRSPRTTAPASSALGALQGPASALRRHALRGAAPASPATETQGHGPGLHPARGDEQPRRAGRQRQARELFWKPLPWLGAIRPTSANDALDPALWETFVSTTLGLEVPILAALPRLHNSPLAKCGCKKFCMDFHGDHTSTCTALSGATKAHDWMVSVLGPLFRTAGHVVRTQHGVTASAGQRRGEWRCAIFGIRPGAGVWSLTSASPMTGLGQAATCSRTGACRTLRT
jgi:hypothetical protein